MLESVFRLFRAKKEEQRSSTQVIVLSFASLPKTTSFIFKVDLNSNNLEDAVRLMIYVNVIQNRS